jgi:hypothetical protein
MLGDLFTLLGSIFCVALWYSTSMIRGRLQEAKEPVPSRLIFNEPQVIRRYFALAAKYNWSRVPVIVACFSFVGCLISSGFAILLLMRH